jgi:hypothetical protein
MPGPTTRFFLLEGGSPTALPTRNRYPLVHYFGARFLKNVDGDVGACGRACVGRRVAHGDRIACM